MTVFRTRQFDAALARIGEVGRHAGYLLEIGVFKDPECRQALEGLQQAAAAAQAALAYPPAPGAASDA
jgi:hypothetical protein